MNTTLLTTLKLTILEFAWVGFFFFLLISLPKVFYFLYVLENRSSGCWSSSSVKLVQLCCIGILLPIVWIIIPVYARFFLYANSAVPLAFTQMRVLDSNFSTFWCQVGLYKC
jgi:hypothetical protein